MLAIALEFLRELDLRLATIVAALLLPLGIYILLSGLDDLFLDLVWASKLFRRPAGRPDPPGPGAGRKIAVFIPLWHEAQVIGPMLDHNLAAIHYPDYEVFVGVYPNDKETRQAVLGAAGRHSKVHLAEVPHDGPTSKADCLNWIYQRMILHEEGNGCRFEIVVVHDAEDLIHPRSFELIDRFAARHDMIQVPVLALSTPFLNLTHGVYCDDFAESQAKDLDSRTRLGGFLPGCGVGTGFRREALDRLAEAESNRIFEPGSLTEDYDNGLRLHSLGCRQTMLPVFRDQGVPIATREYFPRDLRQAIRQRSRWIIGNAIQAWERFGWGGGLPRPWVQAYFLWRDRKGLWGNPVSLLSNLLLLYGCVSWGWSVAEGRAWQLRQHIQNNPWMLSLLWFNASLLGERLLVRMIAVARLYGIRFSLGVPARFFWGNWINCRATFLAVYTWARSRIRKEPLRWIKTDHAYPSRGALLVHKRRLGEILVANGYCTQEALDAALATQPESVACGRHFLDTGLVTEEELYEALSLQQSLPCVTIDPGGIPARVARAIPAAVARQWSVLPFRIRSGVLDLASPQVPDDEMQTAVQRFTRLDVRFHLITPSHFDEVTRRMG